MELQPSRERQAPDSTAAGSHGDIPYYNARGPGSLQVHLYPADKIKISSLGIGHPYYSMSEADKCTWRTSKVRLQYLRANPGPDGPAACARQGEATEVNRQESASSRQESWTSRASAAPSLPLQLFSARRRNNENGLFARLLAFCLYGRAIRRNVISRHIRFFLQACGRTTIGRPN